MPICRLEVKEHFDGLSEKEKRYAYHMARASWLGGRIVLRQVSVESEFIYDLLMALGPCSPKIAANVPKDVMDNYLQVCAKFPKYC